MAENTSNNRDSSQASPEKVKMDKLYDEYIDNLAEFAKSTDKKEELLIGILAGFENKPVDLDSTSGKGKSFLSAQRKLLEEEQNNFNDAVGNLTLGLTANEKKNLLSIVQFPKKAHAFNKMVSFFSEFDLKGTSATPLSKHAPASLLEAQARHNTDYSKITRMFESSKNGASFSKEEWEKVTIMAAEFKAFDEPFQAHIKDVMRYDEQAKKYVLKNPPLFDLKTKEANMDLLEVIGFEDVLKPEQFQKMMEDISSPLPQIANLSKKSSAQKNAIEAYRVRVMNDLADHKSAYDYQIYLANANGKNSLSAEDRENFRTATVRALMQRAQYEQYLQAPDDKKLGIHWLKSTLNMMLIEGVEEFVEGIHDTKMLHISNARLLESFGRMSPVMQQTVLKTLGSHLAKDGVVFVEGLNALSEKQLGSLLKTLNKNLPPEGRYTISEKLNKVQMRQLAQKMLKVPRGSSKFVKEIADFSELSPEVRKQLLNGWKSIEKELIRNKVPPARIAEIRKNLKALQKKGFFRDTLEMARNPVTVMIFAIYISEHPNNIQAALNWAGFIGISKTISGGSGLLTKSKFLNKRFPRIKGINHPIIQFLVVMGVLMGLGKKINETTSYIDERFPDSQFKEGVYATFGALEMPGRMIGDIGRTIGWNRSDNFKSWSEYLTEEKTADGWTPERAFYRGRKDWNTALDGQVKLHPHNKEGVARLEADRINKDWGLRQNVDLVGKIATLDIYREDFLQLYSEMKAEDDNLPLTVEQFRASLEAGEEAAIADTKDIGGQDRNDQYIARLFDGTVTLTGYEEDKQETLGNLHTAFTFMERGNMKSPSEEALQKIASGKQKPTSLRDTERLRMFWDTYTGQLKHVATMVSLFKHLTLPDSKGVEHQMYDRHTWLGNGTKEQNKVFTKRIVDGQMSHILLMLKLERLAPYSLNTKATEELTRLGGKKPKPSIPIQELP
ncbi:MAG: hypothetical protein HOE29_00960 [Candidatus Peribacter sp.]|nr:hypothetical protein [Candidatus Peribacter sp.]MBT4600855.1 hypothetical protein [Candidatus Peribacter sp.]MBT5149129.1 hypothetical protein [Candidatus Peribacter sp.]